MTDEQEPRPDEELVTAYVDGALGEADRASVEALLRERPDLREQAEFERGLRERLRGLPVPEPRPGFEMQVRSALRAARRPKRATLLLPLAALLLVGLWARGLPAFVALEVARDHAKCFGLKALPAKVWSDDPVEIAAWFEKQGTPMPQVPGGLGHLRLVGARYCPLGDRSAPHLYYAGQRHHLSLFVVPGPLRFEREHAREALGQNVRFLRSAGISLAVVAEEAEIADAFAREFSRTVARNEAKDSARP
jgi:anti-sigma factor RsiW